MPQLNKGGKYVFGWSKIADDRTVYFPPMVLTEYDLLEEQEIIIFTGAKITGGFCVTNQKMLSASKLHKILDDLPELKNHGSILAGTFIPYKGRSYSWLPLSNDGSITIPVKTLEYLHLCPGNKLMSIRSSNIAFTMGAKGPLVERAKAYNGVIDNF